MCLHTVYTNQNKQEWLGKTGIKGELIQGYKCLMARGDKLKSIVFKYTWKIGRNKPKLPRKRPSQGYKKGIHIYDNVKSALAMSNTYYHNKAVVVPIFYKRKHILQVGEECEWATNDLTPVIVVSECIITKEDYDKAIKLGNK